MFPIIVVPDDAAEISEQMGTKFKFWYDDAQLGRTLFKEGRPHTGENWAEKLACELAQMIDLPHAYYELARWREKNGVISPSLVGKNERLIHGNELLGRVTSKEDENTHYYVQRSHTATSVIGTLRAGSILPPQKFSETAAISSALDVFIGYLMFDAWIANQDRHSENWAIIRSENNDFFLAPSYDHGSSLARNELDEKRVRMLTTKDRGASVEQYAKKALSALFPANAGKTKAFLTIDAFLFAWRQRPLAGKAWLERLERVSDQLIENAVELIPEGQLTQIAKEFTARLLQINRNRLLAATL